MTTGSVAVAGSALAAGSVAVAGGALTAGSVAVAGSVVTVLGAANPLCVATIACLRCATVKVGVVNRSASVVSRHPQ